MLDVRSLIPHFPIPLSIPLLITGLAVLFALIQACGAVLRKKPSLATWFFCLGMLVLAGEGIFGAGVLAADDPAEMAAWLRRAMVAKALIPGLWLAFSLSYSRGNAREFLQRWWPILAAVVVLPIGLVAGSYGELVRVALVGELKQTPLLVLGPAAKLLSGVLLLASILVLINLEKTIRAAVGTERWRVKFVFLGVGVIFGTRIYTGSMVLLYSGFSPSLITIEQTALLIGCGLIAVAYFRRGFREVEIYPSRAVLQGSVTLILAGAYLTVIGLLAQGVARFGWHHLPLQAFVILLGVSGLAGLLLSDRLRTSLQRWVTRNFKRPEHDFRDIWTDFTQRTSGVMDAQGICRASAELISETFDVLNIAVFLKTGDASHFVKVASTSKAGEIEQVKTSHLNLGEESIEALLERRVSFDLDKEDAAWAEPLKEALPTQFRRGGHRMVVPLVTGVRLMGVMILADRVNGIAFSHEERELLSCIADQVAAALLNRSMTEQIVQAKEMEAFQTMSTFFVHDLKNAANSLGLTLENLPRHFDDPEFRQDALRMIGKTADRINGMIGRLSTLRQKIEVHPVEVDLNDLIEEVLNGLDGDGVEVVRELGDLPPIRADRGQMESVVTNLVINAREACGGSGTVRIATLARGAEVLLMVEDDGCGISPEFIENSLFRPFSSTKSKGLGIGMFQCKMIVEAHAGRIRVESEVGEGTRFEVALPVGT